MVMCQVQEPVLALGMCRRCWGSQVCDGDGWSRWPGLCEGASTAVSAV